jgi:hypothetical protein
MIAGAMAAAQMAFKDSFIDPVYILQSWLTNRRSRLFARDDRTKNPEMDA